MIHVLFVQDDLTLGGSIKDALEEQHGYQVTWLQRGDETHTLLQKDHDFDIIILNAGIPGMTGQAVCQSYRARGGTIPVILNSANPYLKNECLDAGADCFLDLPFSDDIHQAIQKYCPAESTER